MPPKRSAPRRGSGSRSRAEIVSQVLGVLDALRKPRSVAELAQLTGLHPRTVYRVLDALPAVGIKLHITRPARRTSGRPVRLFQRVT